MIVRPNRLSRVLTHCVATALSYGSQSCGTGTDGYDSLSCGNGSGSLIEGWPAQLALDFVEVRSTSFFESTYSDAGPSQIAAFGTLCGGASNPDVCREAAKIEEAITTSELASNGPEFSIAWLVYTAGDLVGSVRSLSDARSLLGRIETREKAVLIARLHD